MYRNLRIVAPLALVLFSLAFSSSAAHAADSDVSQNQGHEVSMAVTGYDPAAAAAHGYRIARSSDGREESIPVSPAAVVEDAAAQRAGRSSAVGSCGRATLTTKPVASRGGILIATSYTLSGGRKSFGHLWKVSGQSRLGTPFTESFSGANNFDSSWSASHFRGLYGFSHGMNSLNLTNHAKLTNGAICTAKIVINSW